MTDESNANSTQQNAAVNQNGQQNQTVPDSSSSGTVNL